MLIEDGDIRFGAVEYDRSAMLARAMDYVKKGHDARNRLAGCDVLLRRCADEPGTAAEMSGKERQKSAIRGNCDADAENA
ncbi:MAG: hypothetical protein ACLVB5_05140 [Christensenellales bacterium]